MDKIEKLATVISGVGDFEKLVCKINELIEAFNQSQKQTEGIKGLSQVREWNDKDGNHYKEIATSGYVETVGTPHLESTTTYASSEPEKQEEWRKRITWEDGEYFMIDGKEANEEDLRDFISQLLSEREELGFRKGCIDTCELLEDSEDVEGFLKLWKEKQSKLLKGEG